jgi:hypothetical protein
VVVVVVVVVVMVMVVVVVVVVMMMMMMTTLPNNTVSAIFLHKLGAVRSVDWIFVSGRGPGGDWANT